MLLLRLDGRTGVPRGTCARAVRARDRRESHPAISVTSPLPEDIPNGVAATDSPATDGRALLPGAGLRDRLRVEEQLRPRLVRPRTADAGTGPGQPDHRADPGPPPAGLGRPARLANPDGAGPLRAGAVQIRRDRAAEEV